MLSLSLNMVGRLFLLCFCPDREKRLLVRFWVRCNSTKDSRRRRFRARPSERERFFLRLSVTGTLLSRVGKKCGKS